MTTMMGFRFDFSGWGISPKTFPRSLIIPAMLLTEPFGLVCEVYRKTIRPVNFRVC